MLNKRTSSLGITKTKANNLSKRGYKHHAIMNITTSRPNTGNQDIIASPVQEEKQMLYSFSDKEEYDMFLEMYATQGAEVL